MKEQGRSPKRWGGTLRLLVLYLVVCRIASGQEIRKPIVHPTPEYPALARPSRLSGTVKVIVDISAEGQIRNIRVIGGNPLFVEATLETLKKWRYEPGRETTIALEFGFRP
jgi:TonB family protein